MMLIRCYAHTPACGQVRDTDVDDLSGWTMIVTPSGIPIWLCQDHRDWQPPVYHDRIIDPYHMDRPWSEHCEEVERSVRRGT